MAWIAVALAGLLLGWLLGRDGWKRYRSPARSDPAQLLRWIDASANGWLILDPGNTIHRLNQRAERLLRIPAGTQLERLPLAAVHPGPELQELAETARRRRKPQRLEWDLGEQELELFALPGEEGWVALEVLSRRSLEAQLEQQERWVSDVAHELKTPLTALLLVGDSLADHVSGRNAVLVERLQRELLRLQQLVRDLLELSRLENTLPVAMGKAAPVALAPLVEQVWMGLRPLAEPRGIELDLQVDEPASDPAQVRGDGSRLHRALLNLLENALRHSPDGGTVRVRIEAGPAWCLLSVQDQGPGLSEEDLAHMFERFYRGDASRARGPGGGSGLGLAIVQQIAATHGGRVQASNHPEGGALLELVLPVAAP